MELPVPPPPPSPPAHLTANLGRSSRSARLHSHTTPFPSKNRLMIPANQSCILQSRPPGQAGSRKVVPVFAENQRMHSYELLLFPGSRYPCCIVNFTFILTVSCSSVGTVLTAASNFSIRSFHCDPIEELIFRAPSTLTSGCPPAI